MFPLKSYDVLLRQVIHLRLNIAQISQEKHNDGFHQRSTYEHFYCPARWEVARWRMRSAQPRNFTYAILFLKCFSGLHSKCLILQVRICQLKEMK
jgi:hypothetical protein